MARIIRHGSPEAEQQQAEAKNRYAPLADRGARFIGWLVDAIISGVVSIPMIVHFGFLDPEKAGRIPVAQYIAGFAYIVIAYTIIHGYFLHKNGQTIGKMMTGTRIVSNTDEGRVSLIQIILLRFVPMMLFSSVGILQIINSLFIFGSGKQCLHDMIAGTKVVEAKQAV